MNRRILKFLLKKFYRRECVFVRGDECQSGFTLIEIMIALAILAVSLTSLYTLQGNALRASGEAEHVQAASLLAKSLMSEKLLEFQLEMEKGTFPDEKEEKGDFDPPNQEYHWAYQVRKVDIPLSGENLPTTATTSGQNNNSSNSNSTTVQAPESVQRSMAQIVIKKINENIRELTVTVHWEELGEEQSLKLTTHVSRVR